MTADFVSRVGTLREGREIEFLKRERSVITLANAITIMSDAKAQLEPTLDLLFEDFRRGEMFDHSETVMGIVVALKLANAPYFTEAATIFSRSRAAEIGRLRHVATQLLKDAAKPA